MFYTTLAILLTVCAVIALLIVCVAIYNSTQLKQQRRQHSSTLTPTISTASSTSQLTPPQLTAQNAFKRSSMQNSICNHPDAMRGMHSYLPIPKGAINATTLLKICVLCGQTQEFRRKTDIKAHDTHNIKTHDIKTHDIKTRQQLIDIAFGHKTYPARHNTEDLPIQQHPEFEPNLEYNPITAMLDTQIVPTITNNK